MKGSSISTGVVAILKDEKFCAYGWFSADKKVNEAMLNNHVVTLDWVQKELELLGQRPLAPPEGVVFSVTQLPNQAACLEQQEQALELLEQLEQELSAPPTLVSKRSAEESFLVVF